MAFRKPAMEGSSVRIIISASLIALVFLKLIYSQASLNNQVLNAHSMHTISTFVEQEDALLGVLTVRESVAYALRLQ